MNYIKRLQAENDLLGDKVKFTQQGIRDMINFLHSPKFVGFQADGSRKDWIATGDVIGALRELETILHRNS